MIATEFIITDYKFSVLNFTLNSFLPDDVEEELQDLSVDIDFKLFESEDSEHHRIDLQLKIFPPDRIIGYEMDLLSSGIFVMNKEHFEDLEKLNSCLLYTCLPMLIGNSRAFLMDVTSKGVFGQYTMPAISLAELFRSKDNDSISE